jgi:tripartite-type tricarboxylate transporter receptor subunit TctC
MACAQDFPGRPVRVIPGETGGITDLIARLMAPGLSSGLGQPVITENRTPIIAIETVAKSPPDGYTLLLLSPIVWLTPMMSDKVSWDPVRDFEPITIVASQVNVLAVHPSLPVTSVRGLIALAKARPGQLDYAAGSLGGPSHLAAELFKAMAGIDIVRINYKGGGPALNALIAGQEQLMFSSAGPVMSNAKAGRLRALAVTSAQPSALVPSLPTIAAEGLPGYESVTILGMFAPANTPDAIITRLNREIERTLARPDVKDKFINAQLETVGGAPERFAAEIKADMGRMGKVIRDNHIRME